MDHAWVHRLQLTAEDRIFAGAEAASMRRFVTAASVCASDRLTEQNLPRASLREQALLASQLTREGQAPKLAEIAASRGLREFGPAGMAVLTSSSLRGAVDAVNTFAPLLNLRHRISLGFRGADAVIALRNHTFVDAEIHRVLLPLDIAKMSRFLRDMFGSDELPLTLGANLASAEVTHDGGAHEGRPGVVPGAAELRLPTYLANRQLPHFSRSTQQAHHLASRRRMRQLEDDALLESVRRVLIRDSDVLPSLSQAAAELALSTRTFRRRLAAHGKTFLQILDEQRHVWAVYYLTMGKLTTDAIAERLGYSESANFRHAFRRWTGSSPRRFSSDGTGHPWRGLDERQMQRAFDICRLRRPSLDGVAPSSHEGAGDKQDTPRPPSLFGQRSPRAEPAEA